MIIQSYWEGNGETYYGIEAQGDDILATCRNVLRDVSPACYDLAEAVCTFVGNDLRLFLAHDSCIGSLIVYVPNYPDHIRIMICLSADHVTEALVHELLHCELLLNGFPYLYFYDADATVCQRTYEAFNLLCHELMSPRFAELGLDTNNFTVNSELTDDLITDLLNEEQFGFAFWCIWWLGEWQTGRFTGTEKKFQWMKHPDLLAKFPDVSTIIPQITEWSVRQEYREIETFETSFNELLKILRLPPVRPDQWLYLKPGNGRPVRSMGKS